MLSILNFCMIHALSWFPCPYCSTRNVVSKDLRDSRSLSPQPYMLYFQWFFFFFIFFRIHIIVDAQSFRLLVLFSQNWDLHISFLAAKVWACCPDPRTVGLINLTGMELFPEQHRLYLFHDNYWGFIVILIFMFKLWRLEPNLTHVLFDFLGPSSSLDLGLENI